MTKTVALSNFLFLGLCLPRMLVDTVPVQGEVTQAGIWGHLRDRHSE